MAQTSGTTAETDDVAVLSSSSSSSPPVPVRPKKGTLVRVSEGLLAVTYCGGIALGITVLYWLSTHGAGTDEFAWAIGACFVGLAVPISLHDIHMHLRHYMSPLQRHFIRLIAMVPVYALASWFALVFHKAAVYLEVLRDLYEAFALWSFYQLMLEFLGGKAHLAARLREQAVEKGRDRAKCLPPVCCLRGWRMGSRFVHRNSVGLYQYVAVRLVVTLLVLIFEALHIYKEGNWAPSYFYLYAAIIINTSQVYALYCLAYLYSVVHDDLAPLRPLYKFLLVKGIVAVTWWQGIIINAARAGGSVPSDLFHHVPYEEQGKAVGSFLFCVEMAFAAIAFHYTYPYKDFYAGSQLAPVALLQRAEEERAAKRRAAGGGSGRREGSKLAGIGEEGGEEVGEGQVDDRPILLELTPLPMRQALLDTLPLDMWEETGDNIRTGFGLTHKWAKRAKSRRQDLHTWADAHLGSSVVAPPASPAGPGQGGEVAGSVTPGVPATGGSSTPSSLGRAPSGRTLLPSTPSFRLDQPQPMAHRGPTPQSLRTKTKSRMTMSVGEEGVGEQQKPA